MAQTRPPLHPCARKLTFSKERCLAGLAGCRLLPAMTTPRLPHVALVPAETCSSVPGGRLQRHAPGYGFRLTLDQVRRIAKPSATTLTWRRVRMRCPSCGFANGEGMLFCGRCGTKLPTPCPACGFANPADHVFCGRCGVRLSV